MARAIALAGVMVALLGSTAHAQDMGDGLDPDLTGVDGSDQAEVTTADVVPDLTVVGESPVVQQPDWIDACLDNLAWAESRDNPLAFNSRSGASGLLQFLPSTFRGTPQGRAGLSIWSTAAQRAAGRWMINQGRLHEWTTWRVCA